MAEGVVQIKLSPTEYRLLRSELEFHIQVLRDQAKTLKPGWDRENMTKRETGLKSILEKI